MKLVWNCSPLSAHEDHSLNLASFPRRIYHGESLRKVSQLPPCPNSACSLAVPLENPVTPHSLSSNSAPFSLSFLPHAQLLLTASGKTSDSTGSFILNGL